MGSLILFPWHDSEQLLVEMGDELVEVEVDGESLKIAVFISAVSLKYNDSKSSRTSMCSSSSSSSSISSWNSWKSSQHFSNLDNLILSSARSS